MLFVTGESGVGKTRLVEALQAETEARGALMLTGRAYPAEGTFPFALAADALADLVRSLSPSAVTLLARGNENDLRMILPTLGRPGGAARAATGADSGDAKARVFWTVEQFVRRASEQRPIVLALENVQWADASSLELLHFLVRQLAGAHVAALCTYNSRERELTPALRAAERSLKRAGMADSHEVSPLSPDDVAVMVRHMHPSHPQVEELARVIYARTLGNPFFAEELLLAANESGGGMADWFSGGAALPVSVRDAVLARAESLAPDERRLADAVAAVGTRAPRTVLERVAGLEGDAATRALVSLCARGFLVERPDDSGLWYECDHPIVQATLYDALGLTRARALHARIADAFEFAGGVDAERHVNEIAWHYSRAGDATTSPKAARFLALAGRNALARYANREAATLLQTALGRAAADTDASARAQLMDDLARARQRLGEYDTAYALWAEARRLVPPGENAEFAAQLERQMGVSAFWAGRPHDAVAHYDAAISIAKEARAIGQAVRTLIARSTAIRATGDAAAAHDDVAEALALATTTGDDALLSRAHRAVLLAYAWTGPAAKAREHAERALTFADASGDRAVAWSAEWAMALLSGFTGDGAATARHAAAADRLAAELGSPVLAAWTAEISVEYAAAVGDWHRGLALADQAIPLARAVAERTLLPRLLVWKGLILLARDDTDAAAACFDESWELSGAEAPERPGSDLHAIIPAHTGRAALFVARREFAEAIRVGERGLALADHHGYRAWAIHRLLPMLCEAALWANDYGRVAAYAARLRRDALVLDHRLGRAWADGAEALLLRLRDNDPRAADALLAAADDLERVPFVFHAARLRRNAAQILAADGHRDRALAELRRAHEMFRAMGAERELRGTREEIRELGGRPPQRSTPATGTLTEREREITELLAQRRTNREIGAALDISPRTVSTHLANIFKKLGVDSRGALIDLTREDPGLIRSPARGDA